MRECQYCKNKLSPLARFCASCGRATGFDISVLKESSEKPIHHKINPSKKRKTLAGLSFALFVFTSVLCVVFIVISFVMGETMAGILFIIASLTLFVYFKEKSSHLQTLIRRNTENRCSKCGSKIYEHEEFCEQCGIKLNKKALP